MQIFIINKTHYYRMQGNRCSTRLAPKCFSDIKEAIAEAKKIADADVLDYQAQGYYAIRQDHTQRYNVKKGNQRIEYQKGGEKGYIHYEIEPLILKVAK